MTVRHLAVPTYLASGPAPPDTKSFLVPVTGVASTPDIAIPAGDITWVMKINGPPSSAGATPKMICGQWVLGNMAYAIHRTYTSQLVSALVSATGSSATAKGAASATPPSGDEYIALTYPASSTGAVLWRSVDKGVTWTIETTGVASANNVIFNSTAAVFVGNRDNTPSTAFLDRVYYIECRTGNNPLGGTLLWRFDADEHVSGTTWTDPRGLPWTLTAAGAITHPTTTGAVRFNGTSGVSLKRSASGLTLATTSITWCAWVKIMGDPDFYQWVMCSDDASANYVQFGCDATGLHYYMSSNAGGGSSSYDFTIGTWAFIAAVMDKSGTAPYLYHAQAPATTLTQDGYMFTLPAGFLDTNTFYIGNGGFNNPINASIAAVKVWNAALTKTELEAELLKYAPVRTANLWAAYKLNTGPQTNDDSGNGRTLTIVGAPTTDSSGPPIT